MRAFACTRPPLDAMPREPHSAFAAQDELAAWIRDPERAPVPAGIEPRRLKIYANLFFNNVSSMLGSTFPVIRAVLGDDGWRVLVRDFLREHAARTPVFTELARELLRYLDDRADAGHDDPPWLRELAHYEWVELALQLSDERATDEPCDTDGDLRRGIPVLSRLAWPLAYEWPVHRIAPGALPLAPSQTFMLLHRDTAGTVRFHALGPIAFHLLHRLAEGNASTGEALLRQLAAEVQASDVEPFVDEGIALLDAYRRDGIVLGTRRA